MQTLSPWRVVTEEHTSTFVRDITRYHIWGVANLYYLDLYKKFTNPNTRLMAKLLYGSTLAVPHTLLSLLSTHRSNH